VHGTTVSVNALTQTVLRFRNTPLTVLKKVRFKMRFGEACSMASCCDGVPPPLCAWALSADGNDIPTVTTVANTQ
jgi:hypothetical protein